MVLKVYIISLLMLISISICEAGIVRVTRETRVAEALERCTKIAVSINEKPDRFTIPQTIQDIRYTCKIYDEISTCIKNVTATYLPSSNQSIIEDSLNSTMDLCSEDLTFKRTYLSYAPCIKRVLMGSDYCGNYYHYLLDHVKAIKVQEIHDYDSTCCAYHKFRKCYLEKSHACDQEVSTTQNRSTVSEFIESMMDQAHYSFTHLCITDVPNKENCHM